MPTTSNFGWNTPADTDLVKDGALAIRTLGNNIDASMADLKGGTTGQVLSKNSNTDMDFTWVTSDDANAIQNAIVDAKGDLITATAADTPARLAVGSNGDTLVADSAATTGLRYTSGVGLVNPVINSAYDIAQRGTSFTTAGGVAYTLDRWQSRTASGSGSLVTTQELTSDTTNLPEIQYCARLRRTTSNSNTFPLQFYTAIENFNSTPFIGKTVTISYYARKSANLTGTFTGSLISGTGTNEGLVPGFTGAATVAGGLTTLTTTWTRYSATGTVSASAKQLGVQFTHNPSGTAGADDYYEVTGVQIDIGSVALPFRRSGGTIQGETALCQRYYWRQTADATAVYAVLANGSASATTTVNFQTQNPVTMRIAPTSLDYANIAADDGVTTLGISSASIFSNLSNPRMVNIVATVTGATVYRPYRLLSNNSSSGYIGLSAEL